MSTRVPATVFPPGEFLKDELECRGWTQVELSEILARPPRLISEIIAGKRAITPETAKGLEAAFGTSAELWMNLESAWQLSKTSIEASLVQRRAKLYGKFPVKELIRRSWIEYADDFQELETNFCRFFGIHSLDEAPKFKHAGKRAEYTDVAQTIQLAWLNRAEHVASKLSVGTFSTKGLQAAINQLQGCLQTVEGVRQVPSILSNAGIRFVIVEYLPSGKLDGACFWLDKGKSPVIALSLRLDRLDNFWHTLFHEIDHISHSEGKDAPIVDLIETSHAKAEHVPQQEARANASAAHYCIDHDVFEEWISRMRRISKLSILAFAEERCVHPALVVGQLQYLGIIPYSFHRDLLVKVRSRVVETATTDGFGSMGVD